MEFKKYSEIENAYRKAYIEYIEQVGLSGGEWVVEEKIHGSNLCIYYNGIEFKYAKKTAFIEEDENFYNCHKVVEDNKEAIIKLYGILEDK